MTRAARAALACLVTVSLAGCSLWSNSEERTLKRRYSTDDYPANPIPGLKKVAVVALDASTQYHPDLLALTSALHSQLQSIEGLEVLPDAVAVATVEKEKLALPRDGLKLADALSADGVFLAIVTDYSPYDEPVIAMGLVLYSRATAPARPVDLDKIIQGGAPLVMPDSQAAKPVTAVFDVYDAGQKTTRRRMELYAEGQMASDVGLGWERYYRSMPHFMRFATYEITWELFNQLKVERAIEIEKEK
jgi:hypothetical protein